MSVGYPGSGIRPNPQIPTPTAGSNNRQSQQKAAAAAAAAAKRKSDSISAAKAAAAKKALALKKKAGNIENNWDYASGAIGGSSMSDGGTPPPFFYIYNAPMVNTSYLRAKGPQQGTAASGISTSSNFDDARSSWSVGKETARGVIQMNASYATNLAKSSSQPNNKYDDKLYGFKFLYNPTEVGMAWGLVEGVNWEVIQSGLDKLTPIGAGLTQTTISFSLLLNRTEDMAFLDSNGLKPGVTSPYPLFNAKTGNPNDEYKQIYQKGTMYDMEYFFKTVNGFNSVYTSSLNGETADQGWLNGIPVELHLGAGLRYLVRISNIDINHTMFTERMVPIRSTLNLTCTRFYDNNTLDPTKYTFSGGTTP